MNDSGIELLARLVALRHAALDPASLGEWALIAGALLLGFVARQIGVRAQASRIASTEAFPDLVQPLVALVLVELGLRILFHHRPAPLLHLAVPLLVSLSVIRLATHLVRTLLHAQVALAGDWERQIARVVWAVLALQLLGLLDPALDMLGDLTLPVGDHQVSVLRMLQGALMVALALVLSLWFGRVLERRIMGVQSLDASLRVIFTKLLRGILLAFAVLFTLPLVGVDITFLSVLGGALGVGLGFGLQKIASNYVSGFIILLDRSVRLNDVVTVDGRRGLVSHMEARYTVLKAADGTETIIPNETFVTSTVINHTLNDRAASVGFSLWLAQDADVRAAIGALETMLRARSEIMVSPGPSAQVNQVNEIGIELQVSWWVPDLACNEPTLRPALLLEALYCLRALQIPLARRPDLQRGDPRPAGPPAVSGPPGTEYPLPPP